MELVLNLGWLAVSAVLFGLLGLRHFSRRGQGNSLAAVTALVCIVCLLFPVISMTDDLYSGPALPEATKLTKLLPPVELAIGPILHALVRCAPEPTSSVLAAEQDQNRIQQEFLYAALDRRPPPDFLVL